MAASTWLASMSASRSCLVPGALADLVEGGEVEADLVEADGGRQHHQRRHQVVVVPDVRPSRRRRPRPRHARAATGGRPAQLDLLAHDPRAHGRGTWPAAATSTGRGARRTWSSTEMIRGTSAHGVSSRVPLARCPVSSVSDVRSMLPAWLSAVATVSVLRPERRTVPASAPVDSPFSMVGTPLTKTRVTPIDFDVRRRLSPGRSKTRLAGPLSTVVGVEEPDVGERLPPRAGPGRAGRTAGPARRS